jgi:hypothetical protein
VTHDEARRKAVRGFDEENAARAAQIFDHFIAHGCSPERALELLYQVEAFAEFVALKEEPGRKKH